MSRFLSGKFAAIEPYTPGEQPQDRSYIKLNTNENPYPPSPKVFEAIFGGNGGGEKRLAEPGAEIDKLRLYSDPEVRELSEAIAGFYHISPEQVLVGNGSDEILAFAFLAFGDETKPVRFPAVSYGFYPVFARLFGIPAEPAALREDFTIDPADYIGCGRNVVIANPNAPTGIALEPAQIEAIVKSNPDHLVIIDEAYVDFGGESVIPLIDRYDNLMVVQTFSKSRSLAGARLGFAAACREIISDMNKMKFSFNPYNVNRLSILAGTAAMKDRPYFERCTAAIRETREETAAELRRMGFTVLPSKANFLFAKSDRIGGGEYFRQLKERGILVRHWDKPEIRDYVRITVGTPQDMKTLCRVTEELLAERI